MTTDQLTNDIEREADLAYTTRCEQLLLWTQSFNKCFPQYPITEAAQFADMCVLEFNKRFVSAQEKIANEAKT